MRLKKMNLKELLQESKKRGVTLLNVVFNNVYYIRNTNLIESLLQEMASVLIDLGEEESIDVDKLVLESLKEWHPELFD